jgi:hypothetical protein
VLRGAIVLPCADPGEQSGWIRPGGAREALKSVSTIGESTIMKKNLLMAGMGSLFAMAAICPACADGYRHDDHGYWDGNNHHHNYAYHHHHRGYWDQRGSARVFIIL